jgi:hypothetical protein
MFVYFLTEHLFWQSRDRNVVRKISNGICYAYLGFCVVVLALSALK